MFKKNKIIVLSALLFVGCFSIAQANYITSNPIDVFGKKQTHIKKEKWLKVKEPTNLPIFGMKDSKIKNYPVIKYDWNNFGHQNYNQKGMNFATNYKGFKVPNKGMNFATDYKGMNFATSYKGFKAPYKGMNIGKHKGFKGTCKTSVPEPSLMIMLFGSLLSIVALKKAVRI
jgi:hypothetical protein